MQLPAEVQRAGQLEQDHRDKHRRQIRLLESTINTLVDLMLIDLPGAINHIRRQNHLAAGSTENRAYQQMAITNLLQVCVSAAQASGQRKTLKHKDLPQKVTVCDAKRLKFKMVSQNAATDPGARTVASGHIGTVYFNLIICVAVKSELTFQSIPLSQPLHLFMFFSAI